MKIHFAKSTDLSQLHDEILAACHAVRPIDGQAQMIVEGDGSNVWLTLPDDLPVETRQQIEAIVTNHTPKSATQPNWVQFRSSVGDHEAYLRIASDLRNSAPNVQLTNLLWRVGEDSGLFVEVAQKWAQMVGNVPLTPIEISQLNSIAGACDVPLRLDEQGRMIPSL